MFIANGIFLLKLQRSDIFLITNMPRHPVGVLLNNLKKVYKYCVPQDWVLTHLKNCILTVKITAKIKDIKKVQNAGQIGLVLFKKLLGTKYHQNQYQ